MLDFMKLNWDVRIMQANCVGCLGQKVLGGDERATDVGDDQAEPRAELNALSVWSLYTPVRDLSPAPHEVR